jgi:hypothetical protein
MASLKDVLLFALVATEPPGHGMLQVARKPFRPASTCSLQLCPLGRRASRRIQVSLRLTAKVAVSQNL